MADAHEDLNPSAVRDTGRPSRIVRRYFLIFATLVGGALVTSVLVEMVFRFQATRQNLSVEHGQLAELSGLRIRHYIEDVAQSVRFAQPRTLNQGRVTDDYSLDLRVL